MTRSERGGQQPSLVVDDKSPAGPSARRAPGPSSTSISFALLVTLMVLTGVFLGEWLWRRCNAVERVGLATAGGTVDVLAVLWSSPLMPGLGLLLWTAACLAMLPASGRRHGAAARRAPCWSALARRGRSSA